MASIILEVLTSLQTLTAQEALSGVFGSISLATWIFLLVPQLILNYKSGSADGISLAFLTVWLVGDIANLSGAAWAHLVPTVIALAVYFCIADFVLISQCLYYNYVNSKRVKRQLSVTSAISEDEPLLGRARSNDTTGLPGSHRRSSAASRGSEIRRDSLSKVMEEDFETSGRAWLRNTVSIFLVCAAGAAGWAIAWKSGVWTPTPIDGPDPKLSAQQTPIGAEVLGYFSAVCYLGARIPQIWKNYKDKSCEGLALLFFLLSLLGNATYGAGILAHSLEKEYILTNLPWLIGSLGTMAEDGIIFIQFRIYSSKKAAVENA